MPRIKDPHTPPISLDDTLAGCTITFVNSQTAGITSNHPDLAQKDFIQLKQDIAECGGTYTGVVANSTHLVATQEQFEKNGESDISRNHPPYNSGGLQVHVTDLHRGQNQASSESRRIYRVV